MDNSWILITGATGGLGRAFAVECASRGWRLFLTDLHEEALETLVKGLQDTYRVPVKHQPSDLTDPSSRASLFETIDRDRLRFWGVINVAGTDYEGSFFERSCDQIRTIIRLNIEGTLEVTHGLLEYRDPYHPFRIINVASLAAFYPMPIKATYAASKRFLLDFSLALREEVRGLGATVTVLCPAGLPTTPECIRAIEAQGLMGQLTTQNIGSVAAGTLDHALQGHAIYIPGLLNQVLHIFGSLVPATLVASFVGNRWQAAHQRARTRQMILRQTVDPEEA